MPGANLEAIYYPSRQRSLGPLPLPSPSLSLSLSLRWHQKCIILWRGTEWTLDLKAVNKDRAKRSREREGGQRRRESGQRIEEEH